MKKFPQIVTFRITSRCNNDCKYCFGPKNVKEMKFSELRKLFQSFYLRNVKAVVLTGGEPLLRKDFPEIICELKKYNFRIFLDTNGDLFFKHKELLIKNVDVLGLPIDFSSASYRNESNLNTVLKILDYCKNLSKRPTIRVGTVVTKDNFKELERIGELLKNYSIDIWKLYQFTPQNVNAVKNKSFLEISLEEFSEATQKIKDRFSKHFKITISRREGKNRAYFFINPDGTVFMPIDDLDICREEKIGNVLDKDILIKWKRLVAESNYKSNAEATFNYKFLKSDMITNFISLLTYSRTGSNSVHSPILKFFLTF